MAFVLELKRSEDIAGGLCKNLHVVATCVQSISLGLASVWFALLERSASFVHLNTGASNNEIFVMHAQFAYIVYSSSNIVRKAVMDEGRDSREDLFSPISRVDC